MSFGCFFWSLYWLVVCFSILQPANGYSNTSSCSHSPAQPGTDPSCELKRDPDSLETDWRLLPEFSQPLSLWGCVKLSCDSTNATKFHAESVGCSQSLWMLWGAGCPTPQWGRGLQRQSLVKAGMAMWAIHMRIGISMENTGRAASPQPFWGFPVPLCLYQATSPCPHSNSRFVWVPRHHGKPGMIWWTQFQRRFSREVNPAAGTAQRRCLGELSHTTGHWRKLGGTSQPGLLRVFSAFQADQEGVEEQDGCFLQGAGCQGDARVIPGWYLPKQWGTHRSAARPFPACNLAALNSLTWMGLPKRWGKA